MTTSQSELAKILDQCFANDFHHGSDVFRKYDVLPHIEMDAVEYRLEISVQTTLEELLNEYSMHSFVDG